MHLAWTLRHAPRWHHSPCRRVASLLSADRQAWQGHWRCRSKDTSPPRSPGLALTRRRFLGFLFCIALPWNRQQHLALACNPLLRFFAFAGAGAFASSAARLRFSASTKLTTFGAGA